MPHMASMLRATQPLVLTPSHGARASSGRWVVPAFRQGRSTTRRTVSKVTCRSSTLTNGDVSVLTIESPELASRKVLLSEKIPGPSVTVKTTVTVPLKEANKGETNYDLWESLTHKNWLLIELISTELDPETGEGWKTDPAYATYAGHQGSDDVLVFEVSFSVPVSFATVGAVHVENHNQHEMFIEDITVATGGESGAAPVFFSCSSWVVSKDDNPQDKRTFFPLKSYLPSQTPKGLERLRKSELEAIRGNGSGERTRAERIYDYDVYNDLGMPDLNPDTKRPVLGGKERPYPRRCRTGRPRSKVDPPSEVRATGEIYVPRDETFSETKKLAFDLRKKLEGLNLFTKLYMGLMKQDKNKNLSFPNLLAIDAIFEEGFKNNSSSSPQQPQTTGGAAASSMEFAAKLKQLDQIFESKFSGVPGVVYSAVKFDTPEIHEKDKLAWFRDEEFARETLAGMNPMCIELLTELPKDSGITKAVIEEQINEVMTAEEAIKKKKLFMLDYHDLFLPYVNKVRELGNTTLYGSRTVFFLTNGGTLRPIAIELTKPKTALKPEWSHVFTPASDGSVTGSWLWQLAKTHVLAHDTGYHQLVSHWLRTHCCVEPYIIAANRQLSQMHPIYRLLHPHFRYTMEINAMARAQLICADGIIESNFCPRKYCMEFSSVAYDKFWRFDMEALPNDLIRRGMAVQGRDGKLELAIEDYPYANDGLLIWDAIREWASDYVNHYYRSAADIVGDEELQAWWTEVRTKGHEDKKDEPWWPVLDGHESLVQVLATIMWVTSAHHAAVNFGQYSYAGYIPNRPTIARKNIPLEDKDAMPAFLEDPEKVLLDTFPSQFQSISVLTTLDLLSTHSPDEEYMGTHVEAPWAADSGVSAAFDKFQGRMRGILDQINNWNKDPERKNRHGAGVVPYTLLKPCDGDPTDEKSVMEMGIPNSISI